MTSLAHAQTMAAYNRWMNERLYALCAKLSASFTFVSYTSPQTRTLPSWAAVAHLFNHQTHGRGQLTTLLKQSGRDPGVTDLIRLPGLDRVSEARCAS